MAGVVPPECGMYALMSRVMACLTAPEPPGEANATAPEAVGGGAGPGRAFCGARQGGLKR